MTQPLTNTTAHTGVTVTAACSSGTLVGGGSYLRNATDPSTLPTNGLVLGGQAPSTGASPVDAGVANGTADPSHWFTDANFTGVADPAGVDEAEGFALCATGGTTHTVVATASTSGATDNANQQVSPPVPATATCPAGDELIGGGATTTTPDQVNDGATVGNSGNLKPLASYPSDASGVAAANGATTATSWSAYGSAGIQNDGGGPDVVTAYALCSTDPTPPPVEVARVDVNGPVAQAGTTTTTGSATCPSGTQLIGGGYGADETAGSTGGLQPQQGYHMRGSYPSTSPASSAGGTPPDEVGDGTGDPETWTAVLQLGGQTLPAGDYGTLHVFAMCAMAPASPTSADLEVSLSGAPDPVLVGRPLAYTIGVANGGPAAATGVLATATLPATATFVSATSTAGSCAQASGTLTCAIGALASGTSTTITVVVTPTQPGALNATATVSGDQADDNPGNNSAAVTTTAKLPAVPMLNQPTLTVTAEGAPTGSGGPTGAATVGDTITGEATLAGGTVVTGTITLAVYGPGDTSCAHALATTSAGVSGNGIYGSRPFATTAPGTYRWVAVYGGDARNAPAGPTPCGGAPITVAASAPTPVNNFGLRVTTKAGRVILHLTSPGRGTFRAVARARASAGGKAKGATARYASGSLRAARAGRFTLTIAPGPAGRAVRRHHRHLIVTVAVTFTPAGGKSNTKNARLAVPGLARTVMLAAAGPAAPSTYVVSGSAAGPSSTFSEVTALADCGGTALSGGGTRLAQTTPTVTHNGIHIDGSFPTPDGMSQAANGDHTPTRWLAAGGSGGAVPNDAQTLAYGVCLQAGPSATVVAVASTPGPTQTFQIVHATATCPAGTQLLSGGSRTTPGTIGSLKPNGSFPSDATGKPVLTAVNPESWTVEGLNGGGGDQSNTTYAFAVCATGYPGLTVTAVHAEVPGPALASTAAQATATCPAGTALLGGGGFISDALGLPGSQGDHLTGSYPSDATGTPVASGLAGSWTAASHTGGADSGSLTQTDAWAMCGSSASGPPPGTGPAVPVSSRAPRVAGTPAVGRVLRAARGSWSGKPTRFSDQWLRCNFSGSTCAVIAGANRRSYAPTEADIGSRLRVRETARSRAGTGTPAVSAPTAPVRAQRVTNSEITTLLARQIVPTGAATKIPTMLVRGYTALPFTALERGRAIVDWYVRDAGGREVLAAQGTEAFPGARATTIDVHLTTAGNTALNAVSSIRLTARGTFVPGGKPPLTESRTFLLTRDGAVPRAVVVPVSFEPNVGQAGEGVRFLAHGRDGAVELTTSGAMLAPGGISIKLAGARRDPRVSAALLEPGTSNYLLGPRRDWRTGVRGYRQVVFHSVYPGIDLRYDAGGGTGALEYDFELAPGADPRRIAVQVRGGKRLRIDRAGNLLADGALVERAPLMYQVADGVTRAITGGFALLGRDRVGFTVDSRDPSRALVIDPTIAFSSEFVGSPPGEGEGIAVDRAGNTYVTGETSSANFPVANAFQAQPRGVTENAFVAKLDPAGRLVYATYLGGSRFTDGRGIAVDAAGNAYVTGATNSTDFPTTPAAVQRSYGGGPFDAFVTKLDPRGSGLVYSTFLGDTHYDEGNAIAVDARGQAVITGKTASPNFPLVRPLAPHTTSGAFVTKLNRTGTGIVSSTVFGGHGPRNHADAGSGIAVDPQGDTYVTGETNDPGFPTVAALQPQLAGAGNAFVIKLNPASMKVIYSTYLGGSGNDFGRAIAADANGDAYVTGQTTSPDFPTVEPLEATDPGPGPAGASAFVTELDPTGNALVYSTYLGASGGVDSAFGIAVDGAGDAYLTGQTSAPNFPLAHPLQPTLRGPSDAFVTELGAGGSAIAFSTYYGGAGADAGLAIALDRGGGVHITGTTDSADFPRRGRRSGPRRYPTPGTGAFAASIVPGPGPAR